MRLCWMLTTIVALLSACSTATPTGQTAPAPSTATTDVLTTTSAASTTSQVPISTSTEPTLATTTSHVPVESSIILSPGGLGVADFGDEVADVLAALEPPVGRPDVDEIVHREEVGAPPGGACAGGYSCWESIRRAEWSDVGLSLTFSDLWWEPGMEPPYPEVPMSLVAYWVVGPQLSTAEGIGVGASVADLETSYGPMLTMDTDFDLGPFFSVVLDGSDIWFGGAGFHGFLSAAPTDSASAVLSITAGRPSSW